MRTILIFTASFFLLFTLSNCLKENSSRWLLVDVYISKNSTGLPIANKEIKLFYWYDAILGETKEQELILGKTDQNGFLKVEKKVTRRMDSFKIGTQTSNALNNNYYEKISVQVKKKNIVSLSL